MLALQRSTHSSLPKFFPSGLFQHCPKVTVHSSRKVDLFTFCCGCFVFILVNLHIVNCKDDLRSRLLDVHFSFLLLQNNNNKKHLMCMTVYVNPIGSCCSSEFIKSVNLKVALWPLLWMHRLIRNIDTLKEYEITKIVG